MPVIDNKAEKSMKGLLVAAAIAATVFLSRWCPYLGPEAAAHRAAAHEPASYCEIDGDTVIGDETWSEGYVPCKWLKTFRDV